MCMIGYRPANGQFPGELLQDAAIANGDGFGMMWAKDGRIQVMRSVSSWRYDEWVPRVPQDVELAVHFRFATHGKINKRNTHPYKVTRDIYLMHNGVLPLRDPAGHRSDTAIFAQDILRPMFERDPSLWDSEAFWDIVKMGIGTGNKLLLLRSDGAMRIVNRKEGYERDGGVWISSNPSYSSKYRDAKGTTARSYAGWGDYDYTDFEPGTRIWDAKTGKMYSVSQKALPLPRETPTYVGRRGEPVTLVEANAEIEAEEAAARAAYDAGLASEEEMYIRLFEQAERQEQADLKEALVQLKQEKEASELLSSAFNR